MIQQLGDQQKKKYARVPISLKKQLLRKIFVMQMSVREASKQLNINYCTAKTILFLHRKKLKLINTKTNSQSISNYKYSHSQLKLNRVCVKIGKPSPIIICASVGGTLTYGVTKVCGFREKKINDKKIQIQS